MVMELVNMFLITNFHLDFFLGGVELVLLSLTKIKIKIVFGN